MPAQFFSPDYKTARARFRELVTDCGGSLEAHEIGQNGPDDTPLTIDVGRFGGAEAKSFLVISSGTHGVEGFFGSAVQLAFLTERIREHLKNKDLGVVLVHAVNPYGFAHIRRVNENNVDLNRNFLAPERPYSGADPGYRKFDPLLNPQTPPGGIEFYLLRTVFNIARYGMPKLKSSLVSGQYEFEKGLFYGGKKPSRSYEIMKENLPRWLDGAQKAMHVDLHTGLGPWGTYVLGACEPADDSEISWLREYFDADRVQGLDPNGVLYEIHGEFGAWCKQTMSDMEYHAVLAEFGTFSPLKVLGALRADKRSHHWAAPADPCVAKAKAQIKEAFAPDSQRWQTICVEKGLQIAQQAVASIS